jgi:NitT/TauT family transport system ATP-binding protein
MCETQKGGDLEPARPALIGVKGVSKHFEARGGGVFVALDDVNLSIADGEFVSLLGPSGCGKSTLLEIVAGLQQPTRGTVTMNRQPIGAPGPDRAVVFQHFALFPWRTVIANVETPMEFAGMGREERREMARGFLRMVGLQAFADRHVWQLSGGMQQRVALARAIACNPGVMLMDEPFSGADAITRELLQDQLVSLHRETRKAIIFVTHSVDEAIRLSDRIAVMGTRPGRIVSIFDIDSSIRSDARRSVRLREEIWEILRREIVPVIGGEG